MTTIDPKLSKEILATRGGLRWLMSLEALASRHGLSEVSLPRNQGTRGTVYPCLFEGRNAVLKIGRASDVLPESEALICWRSRGLAPELWAAEIPAQPPLTDHLAVLILARAEPGTPLAELEPGEGQRLLPELLSRLYPPLPFAIRHQREALSALGLRDFAASVASDLSALGPEHELANGVLMGQFEGLIPLATDLVASSEPSRWRLLHGDMHGYNLLLDQDKLKVIDPCPYWGEPELDLARALIGPPLLHLPPELWQGARVLAAAAGVEADRVFGWARLFGALRLASETPAEPLDAPRRWKLLNLMPASA